jgi:hypothetical protein
MIEQRIQPVNEHNDTSQATAPRRYIIWPIHVPILKVLLSVAVFKNENHISI